MIPRPRFTVSAAIAAALATAACSSVVSPLPPTDGYVLGGTGGGPGSVASSSAGGDDAAPPRQSSPPPASEDAGSTGTASDDSGATSVEDSGSGSVIDTGIGAPDAGLPPAQGALGTCSNPACATDTNECGCAATDSAGEQVTMGCQAGGQCICLVNMQPVGQPFDEDGACGDSQSAQRQFLQSCSVDCP